MSAGTTWSKRAGKHRQPRQRWQRRRGTAAAVGALLLVPVVAAGEPVDWAHPDDGIALAGHAGGGLVGLKDSSEVSADGSLPENNQLGAQVLALAGDPAQLAFTGGPAVIVPGGPNGIPGTMLQAYMKAAAALAASTPNCHLDWPLLASIGRIESNHARGGQVDANGNTARPILGPVLNGGGFAAIGDTDGGAYDGDARWDRAVGPMQFIPSTWRGYASDGNGDGQTNPNNVYDATVGAGKYLCSGGLDVANPQQRATSIFRYNHSDSYVRTVLIWADAYAKGVTPVATTPVSQIEQVAMPAPLQPVAPVVPVVPGVTPTQAPSVPPTGGSTPPADGSSTPPTTPPTGGTTTPPGSSTEPPSSTTPSTTVPPSTTTPAPSCPEVPTSTPSPAPTTTPVPEDPCAAPTTPAAQPTSTGAAGSALPTP
ncbi:lytic transglycosylase domain-containing protein [Actinokineospora sp. NBRC 105648]|uniref:lytic transglycosylase domain-containing protein n=1 Tax=Actinokineospora sp. NBRC 105648 TaxID=3032206 RepID=UPI002556C643|nr:lytic transglycosylase domain-containing protein [Actinokineospora sp. NBRC 105648]